MAYISFQPSDQFNTVLYNSDSGTPLTVTGVGFQPDYVWVKDRQGGGAYVNVDAVRGSTEWLGSNSSGAQVARSDQITSFDSDGWSLGADTGNFINDSTHSNASWNWKAGTTTGIDTTGSTITPIGYSFNAAAGFSIVEYTGNDTAGALVPHGLGVAPDVVMVKALGSGNSWVVQQKYMGPTKYMYLDTTAQEAAATTRWNDTAPTAVNVVLGSGGNTNGSGGDSPFIMYSFANTTGFFHTGEYRGNGSATVPPFIFTGFRPALVIFKSYNYTAGWFIFDDKRQVGNGTAGGYLLANDAAAEVTGTGGLTGMDFYSNGFRVPYSSDSVLNGDGYGYLYMAFASNPFVSSNDIPATAF